MEYHDGRRTIGLIVRRIQCRFRGPAIFAFLCAGLVLVSNVPAQTTDPTGEPELLAEDSKIDDDEPMIEEPAVVEHPIEHEPPTIAARSGLELTLKSLNDRGGIWLDSKHHVVVLQAEIALREGVLELFACPAGTKEHESVVAVKCKAFEVHTALLAVGLVPGKPVQFRPEYTAASGPKVQVDVVWSSADGKPHQVRAQEWIRDIKTGQAMSHDWVFAGSRFWKDEATNEEFYYAEGGELICVSNFSTAMMDLPIESSPENTALLFEAFTPTIPPLGTKVYLVLQPLGEKKQ